MTDAFRREIVDCIDLGNYGTPEGKECYRRIVVEWVSQVPTSSSELASAGVVTVCGARWIVSSQNNTAFKTRNISSSMSHVNNL